ncbi:cysteine protease, partial [Tulasnella sp. 427]
MDAAGGAVTEEPPAEMWFLLTRHVVSRDDPSEFISLDAVGRGGKINAFSEDLLSGKSAYTDSTHILRRVSLTDSSRVSVMLSRDMEDLNEDDRNRPVAFTLTVYSHSAINLMQPPPKRPYSAEDEGKFTSRTSGGNPTHRTFMHNPQYKLRLQPGPGQGIHPLGFRLVVEASRSVAIKATVVWGGGKRISGLNRGDVQIDTGPYVYGTTAIGGLLKHYTLVLSTFTPGQQSPYYISVEADGPVSLEAIPAEGAGMFSKSVKGKWLGPSAAGNPSFGRYRLNPRFDLRISQRTSLFCRLQHVDAPSGTAINVTMFRKDDAGQTNEQVVTSGSYADAVCG